MTRELIERASASGGPDASSRSRPMRCLPMARLAYAEGIDILTPLPPDRRMFADASGRARRGLLKWACHRSMRTIRGHEQTRTVEVAAVGELTGWDSFVEAARGSGVSDPTLWVALVREIAPQERALRDCWRR